MTNRHIQILDVLTKSQKAEVTTLSDILGASQVTVRKDLDILEDKGLIRREHGYACLDNDDAGKHMAYHYEIKKGIAAAAAETVADGETVMIESGSCCAFLAEELAKVKKNVTLVTNSVFIANYVRHAPFIRIVLLGGYYQSESKVTIGPLTKKCGEIFFADKYFVGAEGFSPKFGFTGRDHLRVQTIIDLAEYAKGLIVLTESEKFQQQGVLGLVGFDRITAVYTDDGIPDDSEKILLENNIPVYKVPQYTDNRRYGY